MEIQTLKAEKREPHGRRAAARLRRAEKVPAVVYGHKKDVVPILVDRDEVAFQLDQGAHLVHLAMSGNTETCLIKDVQYDHLGILPLHVDFARVDLTERVRVKVPVELKGHAKGIAEGGVVTQQLMELDVECVVTAIPDSIRVNIADLGMNQFLHIRELTLPEGVRALADAESVVAMCREIHIVETPVAGAVPGEAGPTEPEVIAKGKEPEEGAEGEAKEAEKKPKDTEKKK